MEWLNIRSSFFLSLNLHRFSPNINIIIPSFRHSKLSTHRMIMLITLPNFFGRRYIRWLPFFNNRCFLNQHIIHPHPLSNFPILIHLALSMKCSLLELPYIDSPIGVEKGTVPMFPIVLVAPYIHSPILPYKPSFSILLVIFPLAVVSVVPLVSVRSVSFDIVVDILSSVTGSIGPPENSMAML